MKMTRYMMSGALMGYAVGCRMRQIQRKASRAMRRIKRTVSRKLGL